MTDDARVEGIATDRNTSGCDDLMLGMMRSKPDNTEVARAAAEVGDEDQLAASQPLSVGVSGADRFVGKDDVIEPRQSVGLLQPRESACFTLGVGAAYKANGTADDRLVSQVAKLLLDTFPENT